MQFHTGPKPDRIKQIVTHNIVLCMHQQHFIPSIIASARCKTALAQIIILIYLSHEHEWFVHVHVDEAWPLRLALSIVNPIPNQSKSNQSFFQWQWPMQCQWMGNGNVLAMNDESEWMHEMMNDGYLVVGGVLWRLSVRSCVWGVSDGVWWIEMWFGCLVGNIRNQSESESLTSTTIRRHSVNQKACSFNLPQLVLLSMIHKRSWQHIITINTYHTIALMFNYIINERAWMTRELFGWRCLYSERPPLFS